MFNKISSGIWYRRVGGAQYRATYFPRTKDRPDFIQVEEIESDCPPQAMPVENFFCFFAREI